MSIQEEIVMNRHARSAFLGAICAMFCLCSSLMCIPAARGSSPLAFVTTSPLPDGVLMVPYSFTFRAQGGTPPYKWIWGGGFPPGMGGNSTTASLRGTPEAPGDYAVLVWVEDAVGQHVGVKFALHIGAAVTDLQVVPTCRTVNQATGYTIAFMTGGWGALLANVGDIVVDFPSSFRIPASIAPGAIRINGLEPHAVWLNDHRLGMTVSESVGIFRQVSIAIDEAAGILNPATPQSVTVKVSTKSETVPVAVTYQIVESPRASVTVLPSFPDGQNGFYRIHPTVSIVASSPSGLPVSTYYRINGGGETLYANPIQIPDGTVTLTYFARDSQNNQEQARQVVLKVDSTTPVVTIVSPGEGTVRSTSDVSVTGSTEAGASVTVGGMPASVQSSGAFGGSFSLREGANTIQVVATDLAGNVGQASIKVVLDTKPPALTITSPIIYSTVMTEQVEVSGKTEAGASVTVAGSNVNVAADGTFRTVYRFPQEGLNVIEIISTDVAGNSARTGGIPVTYVARTLISLQVGNKTAKINGASVSLDAAPTVVGGRTLVPLRCIAEAFGIDPLWDGTLRTIQLTLSGGRLLTMQIGKTNCFVEWVGTSRTDLVSLDSPPIIVSGRALVPIRFISEQLGAEVAWDSITRTVTITWKG